MKNGVNRPRVQGFDALQTRAEVNEFVYTPKQVNMTAR